MNINRIIILTMLSIPGAFCFNESSACTVFCISKTGACTILAKNLDWPVSAGYIIINKRGEVKISFVPNGEKSLSWCAAYGSVTFTLFGKDFPLGGMNEAGLIVEELSYSPSIYPKQECTFTVTELQWIQYQLDNYSTVQEVLENLTMLNVSKFIAGLHYFICDKSGNRAVIEFLDGNIEVYSDETLPIPVLTNNTYKNSLKYLKNHAGFGGTRIVSSGPESPERFVRAAELVSNYDPVINRDPVEYSFCILDNVKQSDTQWSIVYNADDLHISFIAGKDSCVSSVTLEQINFTSSGNEYFPVMSDQRTAGEVINRFQHLSFDKNQLLVKDVLHQMVTGDIIEAQRAEQVFDGIMTYTRNLLPHQKQ